MDGTSGYSHYLALAPKDLGKGNIYGNVPALDINVFGASSSYASKGSKRKCSDMDRTINLKDGSSLVLGLGRSSSCTTICSGKEMEEDSSIDLGLSINLKTGDNRSSNPINIPAARKLDIPVLDLQLSLSTGPAESGITSATQGFISYKNCSDPPALAPPVHTVDEGSTSSRWKNGPLVVPLQNIEISTPLHQNHGYENAKSVPPQISTSTAATSTLVGSPGVVNQQQRKGSVKTCQFEGCKRGARGASGLCIAHGGGRRCQRAGCQKGAEGKTVFCKAHGGGRRCQHLGCTKSAEGRTDYCIGHGGGRRCSQEGCTRAARGRSGLCIRHGGGKRCKVENCTKSAEGIAGLCISHGGGRRCQFPDCAKGAQGSTLFCKAHGGGRRCTFLGCTKGAEGSTQFCKGHGGGKRCTSSGCPKSVHGGTLFCVSHGGGKRCAIPECTKSARGRTNYCVRHGGGKRCKSEGCTKSAQGSTDFCKAHGGGKRCSFGQPGTEFGGPGAILCDKFARGKSGLCAAHSAQVQDSQINDSYDIISTTQEQESSLSTHTNGIYAAERIIPYVDTTYDSISSVRYQEPPVSLPVMPPPNFLVANSGLDRLSLPEGRVHGGSLMAMLRGGTPSGPNNKKKKRESSGHHLEQGKSYHMPHSWV